MKMKSKFRILSILIILAGMIFILLPQPGYAQEERIALTLRLISNHYNSEVKVGQDNIFFLEVRNIGNTSISDISISSISPEGWQVSFDPMNINSLSPGNYQTVELNIKTADSTTRNTYKITLIAEANEIREVEDIWVTVETPSYWPWIGIGIAVILVAVFIIIFVRLNKQS